MNNCSNSVSKFQEEENRKLYSRNIPSQQLQPYLDVRPVMTKYSYLPIVDPRREINETLIQQPTYNTSAVFNPGNTQSPWSGFASNINAESELRNQIYALQRCSQSVYVPSSNSDLYSCSFKPTSSAVAQMSHNLLFKEEAFNKFNPNPDNNKVGQGLFMNPTRVQVKDITKQTC
jgi:hypothetical protein